MWDYGYDPTDQLTNAVLSIAGQDDQSWGYQYDAMGNRIQMSEDGDQTIDYISNELNQYTNILAQQSRNQIS